MGVGSVFCQYLAVTACEFSVTECVLATYLGHISHMAKDVESISM